MPRIVAYEHKDNDENKKNLCIRNIGSKNYLFFYPIKRWGGGGGGNLKIFFLRKFFFF